MARDRFQLLRFLMAGCAGAFVVQDLQLRASTRFDPLYPVSPYFLDEVSGCGFSGPNLESLFLVADDGNLFAASMVIGDNDVAISFNKALLLDPPGPEFDVVKAGGCAFDSQGNFYICTEKNNENRDERSVLSVLEIDTSTGKSKHRESEFEVPSDIQEKSFNDLGFESLTASKALGDNVEYLLATTAYSIEDHEPGTVSILAWNVASGGTPTTAFSYSASRDEHDNIFDVVDFASLGSTILVLERLFLEPSYMVRLFEVELDAKEESAKKREVYTWRQDTLTPKSGKPFPIDAHNFAAMCLLPNSSTLLLVNDDLSSEVEGTHFVLLDLIADGLEPYPSSSSTKKKKKKEDNFVWLWVSLAGAILLLFCVCRCFRALKRRESPPAIPTPHATYTDENDIELSYMDKPSQHKGDRYDDEHTDAGSANLEKESNFYV